MALEDTLLHHEHELAAGRGAEYRRLLDDAAIVIVPGQALDKASTAEAMDSSPGWDRFSIGDVRLIELGADAAALHYRFDGRRGADYAYAALMTSVYARRGDDWRLVLHQQTPLV